MTLPIPIFATMKFTRPTAATTKNKVIVILAVSDESSEKTFSENVDTKRGSLG